MSILVKWDADEKDLKKKANRGLIVAAVSAVALFAALVSLAWRWSFFI